MKEIKRIANAIVNHGKILWKGFTRMLFGTATAGLIGLAVYGFVMIPSEGGWTAVCEFIASTATVVVALNCVYAMGGAKKRRGGYAK